MIYIVAVERTEQYLETIEVEAENEDEARDKVWSRMEHGGFHHLFPEALTCDTCTQIDSVYPKEEEIS